MAFPTLLLLCAGTFFMTSLVPGDPAQSVVGENATQADVDRVSAELGLDQPVLQRFGNWLFDLVRGDLGNTLVPPTTEVSTRVAAALPVSLQLAVMALVLALLLAVPIAAWCAYRENGILDRVVTGVSFGLISVPVFVSGVVLLMLFSIHWQIFPVGQWARPSEQGWAENLSHAFLPALTLALTEVAVFIRLLRADMVTTLRQDFVLAARARGMSSWHVVLREALRPSSFSLITLAGISLGRLIGGTVIVEQLFSLPGLGTTVVQAARESDYTLVQGGVLVIGVVYICCTLAVDGMYSYLDPRVRLGGR